MRAATTPANEIDVLWGLGITSHLLERESALYETCFERAKATIAAGPAMAERYRFRADYCRVLEERGRPADAIPECEAALADAPDYPEALKAIARAHLALGDEASAQPYIDRLRRLASDG